MESRADDRSLAKPPLFIGRWTVNILFLLEVRAHRHAELRRRLGTISQRMLTRTLRNLEAAGLISRKATQSKSVTVEYSLTELGRSFMVPVTSVCQWNDRYGMGLSAIIDLSK